jgi:tetratricopeptide (TPR) repeat protein
MYVDEAWLRSAVQPGTSSAKAVVLALHCLDILDVERMPAGSTAQTPSAPRRRTGVTGLNILDPATIAKTAEAFFRNGDLVRAERAFEMALKSDSRNVRLLAYSAWINFWKPTTDRKAALPGAMKAMRDALRNDGKFALAHYFLGALCKQANDVDTAERSFKAALEADPTLMDAQRELRLISMRKGPGSRKSA